MARRDFLSDKLKPEEISLDASLNSSFNSSTKIGIKRQLSFSSLSSDSESVSDLTSTPFKVPLVQRRKKGTRRVNISKDGELNVDYESDASASECGTSVKSVKSVKSESAVSMISLAANLADELTHCYFKNRDKIISPEGFFSTPLHVLKSMSEHWKTPYHSEIFRVLVRGYREVCRVELFIGELRGIGQSPRRKLSFQVAAADLLDKLVAWSKAEVPPYGLIPGFLVNPEIYKKLCCFCSEKNLINPKFELIEQREFEKGPMFVVQCKVGGFKVIAESDSRFLAKRLAAKEMYEKLTHEIVPDDDVRMGSECFGLKQLRNSGAIIKSSKWKTEWMKKYRPNDTEKSEEYEKPHIDEPDDAMIEEPEDDLELEVLESLPDKQALAKIRRVVSNEKFNSDS